MREYLLYGLSVPERALRGGVGLVGGALRESATLLVPRAFQDSQTYTLLVKRTLDFVVENVGGVAPQPRDENSPPQVDNFVARKAVGNFLEMAGLATMHVSPIWVLAVVSDVAYGSKQYLRELADELKRQGLIDEHSTIDHAQDLLKALGDATGVAAAAFDTPPLSVDGLKATIDQTQAAVAKLDPTRVIPQAEIERMWNEMRDVSRREGLGLLQVSGAMAMYALNKMSAVARGALSSVKVAGLLVDRHVIDHYRAALDDIRQRGFYQTISETSGPYVEALWKNFAAAKPTMTEALLNGKLLSGAWRTVRRWLG